MTYTAQHKDDKLDYLSGKHIIVAGAGISGLTFALALHKQWPLRLDPSQKPSITIFERDSQDERLGRGGYSLSIRADGDRGGGVQVLDDLGLYEAVRNAAVIVDDDTFRQHKGGMCLWEPHGEDANWVEVLRVDGSMLANHGVRKLSGMRIRRNALQKVLAKAAMELPDVSIIWNKAISNVQSTENGVHVVLSDGTAHHGDLLVAADGAHSKIRGMVRPDLQPGLNFAGCVALVGSSKFTGPEALPKPFIDRWGMCLGWNGVGSFVAPEDDRSLVWSLSYATDKPEKQIKQPLSPEDFAAFMSRARELGRHLGSTMNTILDATDPLTVMLLNAFDRPPFEHELTRSGPIIFLGDANHALTPFSGNGANMAMMDSWDIAAALTNSDSLATAVKSLEKSMIPRCQAILAESRRNMTVAHAKGWNGCLYAVIARILAWGLWLRTLMPFW